MATRAQLIDLSVSGAQVQVATRLRPLKVARLVLPGDDGDMRLQGTVAWAIAVPSGGAIQYRAGVEFVNPEQETVDDVLREARRHAGSDDDRRKVVRRSRRLDGHRAT